MILKTVRFVLGKMVLALDVLFAPTALQRPPETQAAVDRETAHLVVYQFETCPFCVKVRRAVKRLNLKVEFRDAARVDSYKEELLKGGGKVQVPCLRIPEVNQGGFRWMYESSDILDYLNSRFAAKMF